MSLQVQSLSPTGLTNFKENSVTRISQIFGLNCSEISGRQLNP